MAKNPFSFRSFCVREHKDNKIIKPHQLPLYSTSSFTFDNAQEGIDLFNGKNVGHVYSRYGNPTIDAVADKLAAMEAFDTQLETYAYLTSSGMSAISTIIYALLSTGEGIITQSNLYGGTTELFSKIASKHGINTIFTDLTDLNSVEALLDTEPNIKLIYIESPTNPTLSCVDLEAVSSIAQKHGVYTVIDNTFCTPYLQQPFKHGIDFIIHSTTKYLNGHGNSISGAIIGHHQHLKKEIFSNLKLMGGVANAWDAWLLNNGLKTLALRMDRHCENAMSLANFLSTHPNVENVNYNGLNNHPFHQIAKKQMKNFGGMLSFSVKGDVQNALDVMDNLQLAVQAPTLGDVDTLVLHPSTSSHLNVLPDIRKANGITDNLIRVSVGIEDIEDIINDFAMALSKT